MEATSKTMLITGATSGLGKEAALWFAARGWKVAFCGRRVEKGNQVAREIHSRGGEACFFPTDVTREDDVIRLLEKVTERYGPLDAAFNNAGGNYAFGPLGSVSAEAFEKTIRVNLTGLFYCLTHEIARMRAPGGSIVSTASTAAVKGVSVGLAAYTAAKHGVIGLTRCAALELAPRGVRVNAIALGAVATDSWLERIGDGPGQVAKVAASIPLKKVATPQDILPLVEYLAGPGSAYMTGAALSLDGGVTAGWP